MAFSVRASKEIVHLRLLDHYGVLYLGFEGGRSFAVIEIIPYGTLYEYLSRFYANIVLDLFHGVKLTKKPRKHIVCEAFILSAA
ncbi:MAG: hypothetical protein LBC13_03670 [Clostridiales bacterium]|jgi:hypothetical protein|nr:hypothetical protein [Clostridiales bacterium]